MRIRASTLVLALLLAPAAAGQEVGAAFVVQGRVEVAAGDRFSPLRERDGVELGRAIRTGAGDAVLKLRFDRDGELWMAAHSRVELRRPASPEGCDGRALVATVWVLDGVVELVHDARSGPDTAEVRTANTAVCPLGTRVVVEAHRDGVTVVGVREGKALVRSVNHPQAKGLTLGRDLAVEVETRGGLGLKRPFFWRRALPGEMEHRSPLIPGLVTPDSPLLDRVDPSGLPGGGG